MPTTEALRGNFSPVMLVQYRVPIQISMWRNSNQFIFWKSLRNPTLFNLVDFLFSLDYLILHLFSLTVVFHFITLHVYIDFARIYCEGEYLDWSCVLSENPAVPLPFLLYVLPIFPMLFAFIPLAFSFRTQRRFYQKFRTSPSETKKKVTDIHVYYDDF